MDNRWDQIQDLYHRALERTGNERAGFLTEACAGDDALRREVESLLGYQSEAQDMMEKPAVAFALERLGNDVSRLKTGQQIGSYEIRSILGAGGMGEVYRAHDGRLGRDVAIKVLPLSFHADSERVHRFEREARLLAALNHPNIAAIYGLEDLNGTPSLVLELVEGPTLAERVAQGPLPVKEALGIALQIAEALESAHNKGIIHRDLKPANIKLTLDGRVKVLDFGLGKSYDAQIAPQDLPNSPTLTASATAKGVILGTAAYMSPEQARGKIVDRRCDIWAFGCVLYEMLTGRQAFPAGETVTDTLARILAGEPDWSALPPETPESVVRLVERCLRKETSRRLRHIGDARVEIGDAHADKGRTAMNFSRTFSRGREILLAGLALLFLLTTVVFLIAVDNHAAVPITPAPPGSPRRFTPLLRPPASNSATVFLNAAIPSNMTSSFYLSPDGQKLAFAADKKIWIRRLEAGAAEALENTNVTNLHQLFWSSDSRQIGFLADGKLQKVAVADGTVQTLCETSAATGSWNANSVILLGTGKAGKGPLLSVSANGGQLEPATELDLAHKEEAHILPYFLPDGRHFFYVAVSQNSEPRYVAYIGELGSKTRRPLAGIASEVQYLNGHVLFIRDGKLMAQAFDVTNLQLDGEAFTVASTFVSPGSIDGSYSVSNTGTLAYAENYFPGVVGAVGPAVALSPESAASSNLNSIGGQTALPQQLTWFDRNGKRLGVSGLPGIYSRPELSPNGKYIAFERGNPTNIWILDTEKGYPVPFTTGPGNHGNPRWSADSTKVMFASDHDGTPSVYLQTVGAGAAATKLPQPEEPKALTDWTRDGKYFVYTVANLWWTLSRARGAEPIQLTELPYRGVIARVSPDGKWIALVMQNGLWVQSFPEPGFRQQIANLGGPTVPRWRRDSRELFFLGTSEGTPSVLSVTVNPTPGGSVEFGRPATLFPMPPGTSIGGLQGFAVSADGRFLLSVPVSGETSAGVSITGDITARVTQEDLAAVGTTLGGIKVIINWRGKR